ncbi:hypothetical protein QOL99_10825 [Deinococcus sp. MIMF12]|uniref:Transposase n=1 Tax=Deinococcus rhizophilus TaxID=3049544 RepID=A0ABT7JHU9_9DEIO|nr:hypothetical protein [Deinococcus rhizophilus]MDL2344641.1 hypothetical protein [Deinococcus rhizophilus]
MRATLHSLWTAFRELFLGAIGQPSPGASAADRARFAAKKERVRGASRSGPLTALRTLLREAAFGLIGQPSPDPSRRRRPRR